MKPRKKQPAAVDSNVELQGELHDAIRRWHALVVATDAIAGFARVDEQTIDVVRGLLVTMNGVANEALSISTDIIGGK